VGSKGEITGCFSHGGAEAQREEVVVRWIIAMLTDSNSASLCLRVMISRATAPDPRMGPDTAFGVTLRGS